jgi:glycosyltransferase involved in cell wall biosynthesis
VTIVFFSEISWQGLVQRPQHIASRFAETWHVLWVEPAVLSRVPSFTPVRITNHLATVSLPFFPYNARNRWIRTITRVLSSSHTLRNAAIRLQAWILRRALRLMSRNSDPLLFVLHNLQGAALAQRLAPKGVMYDYIDDLFGFTDFPQHVHREWERAIAGADVVTVTSPTLYTLVSRHRAKRIELISNGVDIGRFQDPSGDRPMDLPRGPVIAYIGSVYPWLDFQLLQSVADTFSDAALVIIGHDHPEVRQRLDQLCARPNASFLGFRPYETIPNYLMHCNVGLIPFQKTPLTAAVNPVKLYEYCAAGIPVVSTAFSADLDEFRGVITVADSAPGFLDGVRDALQRGADPETRARRHAFARDNDWNAKFASMLSLLSPYISGERTPWQK